MNSDSTDRQIVEKEVSPDPVGTADSSRFDRGEAALIVLLLSLVVAGNVVTRWLPEGKVHPIAVKRGTESADLGPVDWTASPVAQELPPKNLNEATLPDLLALPGIGPSLATAILDYRKQMGEFKKVEDLDGVPGIGPRKLETLSRHLFVDSPQNPDTLNQSHSVEPATAGSTVPADGNSTPGIGISSNRSIGRVEKNLNTMDLDDLMEIPGIGEAYANRIIEKRKELGRFREWGEVDSLSGIGSKRLENLRKHATIR
jgi:competence protein ComEA